MNRFLSLGAVIAAALVTTVSLVAFVFVGAPVGLDLGPDEGSGNDTSEPDDAPSNDTSESDDGPDNETAESDAEPGGETTESDEESDNETTESDEDSGNDTAESDEEPGDEESGDEAPSNEDEEPSNATDAQESTADDPSVTFHSCTRAEVSGTFEDGDPVAASTGFYDQAGFGNTIIEDGVVFGEDVDAPFTGTVVFEIGDESAVVEDGDEIRVTVPEYGSFGTAITGLTTDATDYDTAAVTHTNPGSCLTEIQPESPTLDYEDATVTDEGTIDVTFSYENNADAPLPGGEFEGTTVDGPPTELDTGSNEFTVEWTPESDDERLVWTVDMSTFDYETSPTAETPPADSIRSDDGESTGDSDDAEPADDTDDAEPADDADDTEPADDADDVDASEETSDASEESTESEESVESEDETTDEPDGETTDESEEDTADADTGTPDNPPCSSERITLPDN